MAQADLEEDLESGGGFARFMFFVTPILFTVVLLSVLLTLFNMNFRATMIEIGSKIPIVRNFVPDPEGGAIAGNAEEENTKQQSENTEAAVKELKEQVAQKDA